MRRRLLAVALAATVGAGVALDAGAAGPRAERPHLRPLGRVAAAPTPAPTPAPSSTPVPPAVVAGASDAALAAGLRAAGGRPVAVVVLSRAALGDAARGGRTGGAVTAQVVSSAGGRLVESHAVRELPPGASDARDAHAPAPTGESAPSARPADAFRAAGLADRLARLSCRAGTPGVVARATAGTGVVVQERCTVAGRVSVRGVLLGGRPVGPVDPLTVAGVAEVLREADLTSPGGRVTQVALTGAAGTWWKHPAAPDPSGPGCVTSGLVLRDVALRGVAPTGCAAVEHVPAAGAGVGADDFPAARLRAADVVAALDRVRARGVDPRTARSVGLVAAGGDVCLVVQARPGVRAVVVPVPVARAA